MKNNSAFTIIELLVTSTIALIFLAIVSVFALHPILGLFPFGPEQTKTVKVERVYVDYSGDKESQISHYMVGTDAGVFEVDNSIWLWLWNADEIYASLIEKESYVITTKGNKMANFFAQEYPRIISAKKVVK